MVYDFELQDLKRKAFTAFGDDADVGMVCNSEKKVFSLQVPTKKVYLAGLTSNELTFYILGYLDATKEA